MNLRSTLGMSDDERIIAAWPESCSGPGWSTWMVNLVIEGPRGLRRAYLQPEQFLHVEDAGTLADVAEAAHKSFTDAFVRAAGARVTPISGK